MNWNSNSGGILRQITLCCPSFANVELAITFSVNEYEKLCKCHFWLDSLLELFFPCPCPSGQQAVRLQRIAAIIPLNICISHPPEVLLLLIYSIQATVCERLLVSWRERERGSKYAGTLYFHGKLGASADRGLLIMELFAVSSVSS
eukprot:gb/GECG01008507.1/.p1 GENE.gb/GECG01008507.1/~~gb/GECG01008507.1/.p1  ORF type:complete len:146 (+),score=9.92 gb/GECG01008507.1/:1-438(+)